MSQPWGGGVWGGMGGYGGEADRLSHVPAVSGPEPDPRDGRPFDNKYGHWMHPLTCSVASFFHSWPCVAVTAVAMFATWKRMTGPLSELSGASAPHSVKTHKAQSLTLHWVNLQPRGTLHHNLSGLCEGPAGALDVFFRLHM